MDSRILLEASWLQSVVGHCWLVQTWVPRHLRYGSIHVPKLPCTAVKVPVDTSSLLMQLEHAPARS